MIHEKFRLSLPGSEIAAFLPDFLSSTYGLIRVREKSVSALLLQSLAAF